MSESEVDNDVIESEVDTEVKPEHVQPVTIKKSCFLSFIALVLSIPALALSAYMFYQQYYVIKPKASDEPWQIPLAKLEKSTTEKFTQVADTVAQLQQTNTHIQQQLTTIEKIAATIKPISDTINATQPINQPMDKFDDSKIKQQIIQLESRLTLQDKQLDELQVQLTNSNKQYQQELQQIRSDVTSKQTIKPVVDNNYEYYIAESLLQAAYIQLNIKGNVAVAVDLLTQTRKQLQQLPEAQYNNFGLEIENLINEITKLKSPQLSALSRQIDQLAATTTKLSFTANNIAKQIPQQDSAWYDKLIVIRKIDDSQAPRLTIAEQQSIMTRLTSHYEMLKIALISNDQTLWISELATIDSLLDQHFSHNSASIRAELATLTTLDINPNFPDLAVYLQKFKNLSADNSN
ncbi:hypothetical protein MNBD_GAMMA01-842 [hydrothermal vent metagenome]|uniref:Uncharacterized protein n=1 Tax=hydrothermal vent metagenome TaxID=652676 RepID=A0A3B0V836_9ZZZZ